MKTLRHPSIKNVKRKVYDGNVAAWEKAGWVIDEPPTKPADEHTADDRVKTDPVVKRPSRTKHA